MVSSSRDPADSVSAIVELIAYFGRGKSMRSIRCLVTTVACATSFILAACTTEAPAPAPTNPPGAVVVDLYTHCGIRFLQIGDTWYERVGGQLGEDGNPPTGWGNPTQLGQVAFTGSPAVFRDDRGHQEHFTPLPAAPAAVETACA